MWKILNGGKFIHLHILGGVKPVLPPPRGITSPDGKVGFTAVIPKTHLPQINHDLLHTLNIKLLTHL
jgi:hypothetical protein